MNTYVHTYIHTSIIYKQSAYIHAYRQTREIKQMMIEDCDRENKKYIFRRQLTYKAIDKQKEKIGMIYIIMYMYIYMYTCMNV